MAVLAVPPLPEAGAQASELAAQGHVRKGVIGAARSLTAQEMKTQKTAARKIRKTKMIREIRMVKKITKTSPMKSVFP